MAAGIVLGSGVAYVLATIGQGSAALVNVYAVPEQGGQPSLYNQGPLPHSDAMAVGSGSVYVAPTGAAEGIGTIVSLPKQGLEGLVTPGQYRVTSLATGGGYVYWAASGPDATANAGTVRRIKP